MTGPAFSSPSIRHGTVGDAAEIARLLVELGHRTDAESIENAWEEWAVTGNSALVAPGDDETLLGVVTLHRRIVLQHPRPVGRITTLVVDARAQRRGIGRELVAAAEAALARDGCGQVEITSNLRLVEAHAFYTHLGYEHTSVRLAKFLAAPGD